ncbi:dihydrofolate reductase [Clostridium sp. MSJ-8]|uniref:dihydrofolate reductase n=1 Tax=Clostridium sp. MSJ-8 TaxID=2841510 RepID=UPI001C0F2CB9|nr:dihydrofolate reductase [Clostridium sp. MSJ-8]
MFSLIVAIAENNVIGKDNKLIWNIPEDLKRFKEITTGKSIIMGRKTFESLPRILPNRHHIVITRNTNYVCNNSNVTIINNIDKLLKEYLNSEEEVIIIGGAHIYKLLLPYCKKIYLTKIYNSYDGDTFFDIDFSKWTPYYTSEKLLSTKNNVYYQFIDYKID